MVEYHLEAYYTILMTVNLTLTLVVMLAACLCCKKKVQKNELLGLEGMVKLKNPDEIIIVNAGGVGANNTGNATMGNSESQAELNASTVSNADSEKRSSTAAHRSLPDIPIAENNDNGSELYETVADKMNSNGQHAQHKSPSPSLKKQTSVSQHSSISQADDVSSPYSRVKNLPHDYAKVRATEHPYAQLHAPTSSSAATSTSAVVDSCHGAGNTNERISQLSIGSTHNLNTDAPQAEIPAASAIAGMISASQDLPYMTPPISNQHFSGDSQDSSKGYTSISVREPLANILAQQPQTKPTQRNPQLSRDTNDSHYATVSDDSDETYAAIEDPNSRHLPNAAADIYTSGSETYAQIQPMQMQPIVVAVEINSNNPQSSNLAASTQKTGNITQLALNQSGTSSGAGSISVSCGSANTSSNALPMQHNRPHSSNTEYAVPIPPPVDSLRAQMHSRQASSSSNNSSSICNLGSPKPEKRQANSPLPPTPTPKSNAGHPHLHASSNSNLTSGRNSVISVVEIGGNTATGGADDVEAEREQSPQKKHSLSPSKDIEGMYAKVMKKHKFSRHSPSSQQNSPILTRKQLQQHDLGVSPLDSAAAVLLDSQQFDKSRVRSNSYSAKDHGYETIPADGLRNAALPTVGLENRKSDCYANILQKERQQQQQQHTAAASATTYAPTTIAKPPKHYETIASPSTKITAGTASIVGNDPGYELLLTPKTHDEDAKKSSDYDPNYEVLKSAAHSDDGYAKVIEKKHNNGDIDTTDGGYSKLKRDEGYSTIPGADANHNYASILETKASGGNTSDEPELDHYARIAEAPVVPDLPPSIVAGSASVNCLSAAMTSPSSLNSSTLLHNSSSVTTVTTSTSTISSRQTPVSSQYESLTGSETDPNYESVCYLNSSREVTESENPYERLNTEVSETTATTTTTTQLSSTSSPITPDFDVGQEALKPKDVNATMSSELVDDYFQV